jgi:uncharacterized protein (TIGR02466 family)
LLKNKSSKTIPPGLRPVGQEAKTKAALSNDSVGREAQVQAAPSNDSVGQEAQVQAAPSKDLNFERTTRPRSSRSGGGYLLSAPSLHQLAAMRWIGPELPGKRNAMPFEFYFPKTFYYRDDVLTEAENETLLVAARKLRQEFPHSTRPNLYTTYGSIADVLAGEAFAELRRALVTDIQAYLEQLETRASHEAIITDSWISISAPGNYERMHTHGGSYVSGVYYIKVAPESGRISFETLDDNLWASARKRQENWNALSFDPVERRVILFNSQVPHYVSQNMSQIERIALSFNVTIQ